MPGSEYGNIPFADEIKALIDALETTIGTLISSLETTIGSLETAIASLETDLEAYGFAFLFKQWKWIASDDLLKSSDAEVEKNSTSPILAKTIPFDPTPTISTATSTLRIKFDYKQKNVGSRVYARVYKNGSPIGVERTTQETTWQASSEDLGSWEPGDSIQLYCWTLHGDYPVVVRNFRVYGEKEGIVYPEPTW